MDIQMDVMFIYVCLGSSSSRIAREKIFACLFVALDYTEGGGGVSSLLLCRLPLSSIV